MYNEVKSEFFEEKKKWRSSQVTPNPSQTCKKPLESVHYNLQFAKSNGHAKKNKNVKIHFLWT
jgi:hypothetical protein